MSVREGKPNIHYLSYFSYFRRKMATSEFSYDNYKHLFEHKSDVLLVFLHHFLLENACLLMKDDVRNMIFLIHICLFFFRTKLVYYHSIEMIRMILCGNTRTTAFHSTYCLLLIPNFSTFILR